MTPTNEPLWAAASAPVATTVPWWTSALSTLLALALVLGLAVLVLRVLRRLQLRRPGHAGPAPQVLSVIPIGPRERLVLVAHRGRHHLLAFSAGGVCRVDSHDAPEDSGAGPGDV